MGNILVCNLEDLARCQLCFIQTYVTLKSHQPPCFSLKSKWRQFNYSTSSTHFDSKILLFNVGDSKKYIVQKAQNKF